MNTPYILLSGNRTKDPARFISRMLLLSGFRAQPLLPSLPGVAGALALVFISGDFDLFVKAIKKSTPDQIIIIVATDPPALTLEQSSCLCLRKQLFMGLNSFRVYSTSWGNRLLTSVA